MYIVIITMVPVAFLLFYDFANKLSSYFCQCGKFDYLKRISSKELYIFALCITTSVSISMYK